tara:strand:+ start:176 stop:379 length:204 start_codon:yes stop_codon:yes gene_type:complete
MSNNKQSSVESLFQKLWDTPKDKFTWYAILEEHKAMHKEEIVKANEDCSTIDGEFLSGEKYYKETFE